MVKQLKVWACNWKTASFESESFQVKPKWFNKVDDFSGYAYKFKGQWYVLWKDRNKLVLQTKTNKFIVGENYKCELTVTKQGERIFTILDNEETALIVRYKTKLLDLDPTSDLMDEEMDDFFFWLYRLWNDESWSSALIKRYS